MGGFEGGDEAGFWDEDAIATLLKKQQDRKTPQSKKLSSRVSFVPSECESFTLEIPEYLHKTSLAIQRAYSILLELTADDEIVEYFLEHKVVISQKEESVYDDTEAFLLLCKDRCNLVVTPKEIESILTSSLKGLEPF